jgi:hypothetical protein
MVARLSAACSERGHERWGLAEALGSEIRASVRNSGAKLIPQDLIFKTTKIGLLLR